MGKPPGTGKIIGYMAVAFTASAGFGLAPAVWEDIKLDRQDVSNEFLQRAGATRRSLETIAPARIHMHPSRTGAFYGEAKKDRQWSLVHPQDWRQDGVMPCKIEVPEKNPGLVELAAEFGMLPKDAVRNMPGTMADYLKILLYHEARHCAQDNMPDGSPSEEIPDHEFDADRTALALYLTEGGNRDVVRAWLYMRVSDAMISQNNLTPYSTIGPLLFAQHFGGLTMDGEEADNALIEIKRLLNRSSLRHPPLSPDLRLRGTQIYNRIKTLQSENPKDLTPQMHRWLQLYTDAYEFFTRPAAPKTLPAPSPTS